MGINNNHFFLTIILLILCLAALPFFLELYTYHLYLMQEKTFFAFSGARLWFFLAFEVVMGLVLGRIAAYRNLPFVILGSAFALFILMALLYQFCDSRQCYDLGPHNLGPAKLWVLLFGVASVGILAGMSSRGAALDDRKAPKISLALSLFFSAMTCIVMAYYPLSMVYGTAQQYSISIAFIIYAATVPPFFSGLVLSLFSRGKMYARVAIAVPSLLAISVLFIEPANASLLFVVLAIGTAASVISGRLPRIYVNANSATFCRSKLIGLPIIAAIFVSASHPFIDASINLDEGLKSYQVLSPPAHYDGFFYAGKYFPTKRIEIGLDFANLDFSPTRNSDAVLAAGMGAQSPNCCKDGLDYGYRSDILFKNGSQYLVARAWGTCDQNMACSGTAWKSLIHQEIIPYFSNSTRVALAMEWSDDNRVTWYFKSDDENKWLPYSTFVAPKIDNPFFNIGVFDEIGPLAPLSNPPSGDANFLQFGMTADDKIHVNREPALTFLCPAYRSSEDGGMHLMTDIGRIAHGNSHWKALWKWGGSPVDENPITVKFDTASSCDI